MARIEMTPEAILQLEQLPRNVQKKVGARIEALADEPVPHNAKKMHGHNTLYRIRFSEWRIVYQLKDDRLVVVVVRVGHRRSVYDGAFPEL